MASPHEITQLLQAWSSGEQSALDQLIPLVYDDLHRLAQRHMATERDDHTLQATALVHEAYVCGWWIPNKPPGRTAHTFSRSARG